MHFEDDQGQTERRLSKSRPNHCRPYLKRHSGDFDSQSPPRRYGPETAFALRAPIHRSSNYTCVCDELQIGQLKLVAHQELQSSHWHQRLTPVASGHRTLPMQKVLAIALSILASMRNHMLVVIEIVTCLSTLIFKQQTGGRPMFERVQSRPLHADLTIGSLARADALERGALMPSKLG